MLKNKVLRNTSWIIGCRIVQALFSLIITMLSARYLGPSNYGVINYAASIVAFVVPIVMLGLNHILVQEFVNSPEKEGEILGSALLLSCISSLVCIVGVSSFSLVANANEPVTVVVCSLYSLMLLPQALELSQYWFQANYYSQYTSISSLIAYAIISAYKIFLLISGKSIYWFAVSNALDYLLIAIALFLIYRKLGGSRLTFSKATALRLFSKSRYYIVSSLMVTIFAQTDKIMIKFMMGDSATGFYSAAVQCAGLGSFVFGAIIDSARPSVFECAKEGNKRFENRLAQLYSIIIYLSLLQSVFMTLFAKPIIGILYGKAYFPAISALKLIVWYTTFAYLGAVRNIWILSEGKQKYLWIINLSGALCNVVLNMMFIPNFGINGAAFASLCTQIFTNVIIGIIIKPIRRNNYIMLKALDFRWMFRFIKAKSKSD